ncbi:LOW QUALITY PROTEIN: ceramide kinase-like [Sceloporus undulatus]|uniref:LOW QUALITY PROTEIN: ceramide kinase-like n=1 Tax=Sceloporus undulatus TaxID=8520 RepID=UPI001C4CC5E3|nr:LOW QUALITY PROTEIN: ceramide kinase-like [Sceloporus undulatus]
MGETFLRCPLRTPRGRFLVSLPPGGHFLLGTPELVCQGSAPGFCIPTQEMVTVKLGAASSGKEATGPAGNENRFTVFFVQREKQERWSLGSLEFTAPPTSQMAMRWVNALQIWIRHHGITRPRSLLIFINPVGGRKRAVEIYQNQVAPLFTLAGIYVQVVETCRANEARDYILHHDLCDFDGLVSVGGDGTFNEVMHALLDRTQRKAGILEDDTEAELLSPRLRIGIIPAGSTDCVCFATVGTNDPVTSALHIIIGDSQPLDVCSIWHNGKRLRYSVSLVGYGFYGDVVSTSEQHRWMGPMRYTYAGAKAVLSNRSYEGTVEFQLARTEESNPRDQKRCRSGCMVCSETSKYPSSGSEEEKPPELQKYTDGEWQRVQGRFLAVNLTSMSSACPKSPEGLSPCAHLADGTADLILVHECPMFSFLRHLTRHTNCSDQFDLPFVSVYRVRAVRFTSSKIEDCEGETAVPEQRGLCRRVCQGKAPVSCWTCDGETLNHPDISIRVHRSLIQLFARGIEQVPCTS